MRNTAPTDARELEALETREWLESLDYVLQHGGPARVGRLLRELGIHAQQNGVKLPFTANTPYINTIHPSEEVPYPGSREIERRIKSLVRWNAMAMVVRANRVEDGIGGHISTFASSATLYEVGLQSLLPRPRARRRRHDLFPGPRARPASTRARFSKAACRVEQLENFRRELKPGGGLSSYPHPWLMPDFWEFPTVSMGLGPIMAIYQARFNRYLEDRGLKPKTDAKVWAFLGDGETDEPEALGAITLASREKLDNLIFVINCNLQRLDGPVRGNGQIIQELEAIFRGAGWNVHQGASGAPSGTTSSRRTPKACSSARMGEVVDVFQTGSGTSSNMNANEVIANLAGDGAHPERPRQHGASLRLPRPFTWRRSARSTATCSRRSMGSPTRSRRRPTSSPITSSPAART